jgi:uncharacterized membrane protein YhaH (DUF805 family)
MKGNIIGFDPETNVGAISGYDGRRYDFTAQDLRGNRRPRHGDVVDFVPEGERAAQVYLLEPQYMPPSFRQFYFSLRGRISRSQYWLRFFLPVLVIGLIFALFEAADISGARLLANIWQLAILWPSLAMLVKRIHDRDKPGVLVWALYGPMIVALILTIAAVIAFAIGGDSSGSGWGLAVAAGLFWVGELGITVWFFVEFGCMRGTIGANDYGPDPVPQR